MTKIATEEIECPRCKIKQTFNVYNSVNVSLDPELKDKLLSGELTLLTCKNCGLQIDVDYPLLYHEMKKEYLIYLIPHDGQEDVDESTPRWMIGDILSNNYRLRTVLNKDDLKEKITIFDNDLDDRVIEFMKLFIKDEEDIKPIKDEVNFLFEGCDYNDQHGKLISFLVLHGDQQGKLVYSVKTYEVFKEMFQNSPFNSMQDKEGWLRVDGNYFKP